MKIFEVSAMGRVTELSRPKTISLGETGRGRNQILIPVIYHDEEEEIAFSVSKSSSGLSLHGNHPDYNGKDSGRCIAVLQCHGGYSKGRKYSVPNSLKEYVLACGQLADGMAGQAMQADEALCVLPAGVSFALRGKYATNHFMWDGTDLSIFTPAQWNERKVREEFVSGEIKWL